MEKFKVIYCGKLFTEMTHLRSGSKVITEAPVDNNGSGSAFSPTDLVASSLGSCILTVVGIAAEKHHFSIDGSEVHIGKIMTDGSPRRIKEIILDFNFSGLNLGEKEKKIIEFAIENCPVTLSIHPDIVKTINITY